ncbi:MAG: c(7)-type cytochrome triheme domain-containing protein [Thermodesulfobacteriota bacterium]
MLKDLIVSLCLVLAVPAISMAGLGDMTINSQAKSRKDAGVGPVVFPHTTHETLYKCGRCHPRIFKKKRGADLINMNLNMSGKFCGSPGCHNSTKAFPLYKCFKCHQKAGK